MGICIIEKNGGIVGMILAKVPPKSTNGILPNDICGCISGWETGKADGFDGDARWDFFGVFIQYRSLLRSA